jgi:hypothetical protein
MKLGVLAVTTVGLAACVPVSSSGIYRTPIDVTIQSAKAPKDFALCVSQALIGNNPVTNDGNHYWVTRVAYQGQPFARWDFFPAPGGSVAQLRSVLLLGNAGDDRVRRCA